MSACYRHSNFNFHKVTNFRFGIRFQNFVFSQIIIFGKFFLKWHTTDWVFCEVRVKKVEKTNFEATSKKRFPLTKLQNKIGNGNVFLRRKK